MSTPERPWPLIDDEECRRATTMIEMIGRRWSSSVLLAIGRGAHRFREIRGMVDGLSDRMLSVRLRELEQAGLVARAVQPTMPVTVQYGLTPRGAELLTAIQPLARYAQRWAAEPEEPAASA
ncbi:winged helix-turn-helix transcriptional regulator [Microbacterium sediminis]|uniref:Transcriptional regulator n=1 Tax=Microbacterium sediminis TaxID=904291 RepID=A0A1B9NBL0_9MICO|nr:helix-turn-helix domain-containing protein [Microbacterium sediminis]OCG73976.1 transcriptional regulator [Microbacterium sediminis]